MRILQVSRYFLPEYGGIQTHVVSLSKKLSEKHRVMIVAPNYSRDVEGIPVVGVDYSFSRKFRWGSLTTAFREIVKSFDPDIIHAHHLYSHFTVASVVAGSREGVATVLTNHTLPLGYVAFGWFWRAVNRVAKHFTFMRHIPRHLDVGIAVSEASRRVFREFFGGEIHVVPPAVDDDFFLVGEKYVGRKEEFGVPEDSPMILYIGRLSPKKGLELLLYAFKKLLEKKKDAYLVLAGQKKRYGAYLEKLAGVLEIRSRVVFTGSIPREKLLRALDASDIVVFPSYGGESFGIALLEALASGKPVVATVGEGARREAVREGVVYPAPYSPKGLADAVLRVLSDEKLQLELGIKGRKFARRYSWESLLPKILWVYRRAKEKREGILI